MPNFLSSIVWDSINSYIILVYLSRNKVCDDHHPLHNDCFCLDCDEISIERTKVVILWNFIELWWFIDVAALVMCLFSCNNGNNSLLWCCFKLFVLIFLELFDFIRRIFTLNKNKLIQSQWSIPKISMKKSYSFWISKTRFSITFWIPELIHQSNY